MKRRDFMTVVAGAAATWPVAAWGQQPSMPVVGFISGASARTYGHFVAMFHQGLSKSGFRVGENVLVEYRWAEGRSHELPVMAAELVGRNVAVIAATGGAVAGSAAMAATKTIPIVFMSGSDPVASGLVNSLNRPGGNLTGVNLVTNEMGAKRLGLLHEVVPSVKVVGVLTHTSRGRMFTNDSLAAGPSLGLQIEVVYVDNEESFEAGFVRARQVGVGALLVQYTPMFTSRRSELVALAARHAIPAIYGGREYVEAEGLMSYGSSLADAYRQVGVYTGRILKGEKPSDLPVVQPTKFELVLNLKTANALGLAIPPKILALADEVIE